MFEVNTQYSSTWIKLDHPKVFGSLSVTFVPVKVTLRNRQFCTSFEKGKVGQSPAQGTSLTYNLPFERVKMPLFHSIYREADPFIKSGILSLRSEAEHSPIIGRALWSKAEHSPIKGRALRSEAEHSPICQSLINLSNIIKGGGW